MRALPEEILTLIIHSEHNTEPQWKAQKRHGSDFEGFRTWLMIARASFADLKTFCFVSKAFRRISQPLLYRRFDKNDCLGDSNKRMRLFLRTILENPKLGLEVEEVALGRYDASMGHRKPSSDLARLYNGDLRSSSSLPNDLYEDLSNGGEDAEIVFLISLCPNIEALSFTASPQTTPGESWLTKVLLQHWANKSSVEQSLLTKGKRILPNLQHLSFEHYESEPGSYGSLGQIMPFPHLPHLQHLSTDMVSLQESIMRLANNAPWPLISITLQNTVWRVSGVSSLLQACPHLEKLSLTAADYDGNSTFCDLDFHTLGVVLRLHGTALRSLTIDARGAFGYGGEYGDYWPLLGSLKPLARLEHLRVPLEQLLEHEDESISEESIHARLWREVLPESITNLELLDP